MKQSSVPGRSACASVCRVGDAKAMPWVDAKVFPQPPQMSGWHIRDNKAPTARQWATMSRGGFHGDFPSYPHAAWHWLVSGQTHKHATLMIEQSALVTRHCVPKNTEYYMDVNLTLFTRQWTPRTLRENFPWFSLWSFHLRICLRLCTWCLLALMLTLTANIIIMGIYDAPYLSSVWQH